MYKIAELSTLPKYFRWEFPKDPFNPYTWIEEKQFVHDADNCGNRTSYYVVMNEGLKTIYCVKHAWWWGNFGQESSYLENEFEIEQVDDLSTLPKEIQANLKFAV